MRPRVATASLCLLLSTVSGVALAQERAAPSSDRLRLSLRSDPPYFLTGEHIIGRMVGLKRDTLFMSEKAGQPTRAIPMRLVESVDVSIGKKGSWHTGYLIGFAVGAVIGVAVGSANSGSSGGLHNESVALYTLGGALVGSGIGALIGRNVRTDIWEEIPISDLRRGE